MRKDKIYIGIGIVVLILTIILFVIIEKNDKNIIDNEDGNVTTEQEVNQNDDLIREKTTGETETSTKEGKETTVSKETQDGINVDNWNKKNSNQNSTRNNSKNNNKNNSKNNSSKKTDKNNTNNNKNNNNGNDNSNGNSNNNNNNDKPQETTKKQPSTNAPNKDFNIKEDKNEGYGKLVG